MPSGEIRSGFKDEYQIPKNIITSLYY